MNYLIRVGRVRDNMRTTHVIRDFLLGVSLYVVNQFVDERKTFIICEVLTDTIRNTYMCRVFDECGGLGSSIYHCRFFVGKRT